MSQGAEAMRVARWSAFTACIMSTLAGCGSDTSSKAPLQIEIGIPDKETRRMFVPLAPGGDIFYFKGLQVEEFVMLAVRVKQAEAEAFVDITVEDLDMGTTAARPALTRPEPLECASDGWCTLAPVLLPARLLGALDEITGTHLKAHCEIWRDDGARGEATIMGILRPQQ